MTNLFDDVRASDSLFKQEENKTTQQHVTEELTYFQKLSLKERGEQQAKTEAHDRAQLRQMKEHAEKAQELLNHAPINEKAWDRIMRKDAVFYHTDAAQAVRLQHKQELGLLFYS